MVASHRRRNFVSAGNVQNGGHGATIILFSVYKVKGDFSTDLRENVAHSEEKYRKMIAVLWRIYYA